MIDGFFDELQEQGRGVVGALVVVGISFLNTMEAWWLGAQLPIATLLAYAVVGLVVVLVITRSVGFREEEEEHGSFGPVRLATDFAELVLQSFVTAYAVWLLFGIIEIGDSPITIARFGLFLVVPLAFGAALANKLFKGTRDGGEQEQRFPRILAVFALGAIFTAAPISLTEEIELISAHAGWWRLAMIIVVSIVIAYLTLYELEFQGQEGRIGDRTVPLMVGSSFMVYLVAVVVSVGLLASFGHLSAVPLEVWTQKIIVLSFPATVGASASRVVLG